MNFTLYHHGSSVCAAMVRMAMAEKELAWDGVYIDILAGEQFKPDYVKINPKSVVPTLIHDDVIIPDSTVICEYLDHIAPDISLHPENAYARAQVRYWTKAVDEDLHPACGAVTFVCSHRHTVMKNLGEEGTKEFLASTPEFSVTSDWKSQKDGFIRYGFEAPGATEKIKLYDSYLSKMEQALNGSDWLVNNEFTIADVAMTPYVNRLDMMNMSGMWEHGRLPRVTDWFARIKERPTFHKNLIEWVPEGLTADLHNNGTKSWPEVAKILDIKH
jgi:glutathione S-transferase